MSRFSFVDEVDYFDWLVSGLGDLAASYQIVLEKAFETPFYEKIPNDSNRADDGLVYRERYEKEVGKQVEMDECSVLEMLLGLADRMNTVAYDYKDPEKRPYWFWLLMANLGMMPYFDQVVDPLTEGDIARRFHFMVERTYRASGSGGLFPLEDSREDQRDVEIWYQMMSWINENQDGLGLK